MNDLQVFNSKEFGEVRVSIDRDGQPWFVAADVCKALEHTNVTVALDRLDEDEKAKLGLGLSGGETNVVNEPGLYALILGSRKKEAHAFKRWITHDVIPTIRKTGGYVSNEDSFINTYLPNADEQTKAVFRTTLSTIRSMNQKIDEDRAKVLFADAVSAGPGHILIGDLAKLVKQNGRNIGQNRLFQWMRANGYLMQVGSSRNMPTQHAMELDLFRVKETAITHADGTITMQRTTMVTGKGQRYFMERLLSKAISEKVVS